jgi:hypothetical protein
MLMLYLSVLLQYQDLMLNPFKIRSITEGTAAPPNFNAPNNGHVGQNM